jgi:putative tryptophan/tyrosine transport system substrate-binding protein
MKRRAFVKLLAGAAMATPFSAFARAATNHRLAILVGGPAFPMESPPVKIIISALAGYGYTLGQNLEVRSYGGDAHIGRLPQLAKEIAATGADAVVVLGWPPANAMKASGVPTVVAVGAGDPVATGLAASLARPGGNVTGISDNATTLSTKRSRTSARWRCCGTRTTSGMTLRYQASADAAKSLGSAVQPLGVREPDDFADAFAAMDRDTPDAILMVADALTLLNRKRVFDYAAAHRLPAIYEQDLFVRDGGLMSYGADFKESLERAASLIDRIFKGAKPADLPFEEPTHYLFVVNLKTAKSIGLELPPNLLALADEVIE